LAHYTFGTLHKGEDWQREKSGEPLGVFLAASLNVLSRDPHRNYQSRLNQWQTDVLAYSGLLVTRAGSQVLRKLPVGHFADAAKVSKLTHCGRSRMARRTVPDFAKMSAA